MYIIAPDVIAAAQALAASPETTAALGEIASLVDRLHELEAAYPERIHAARIAAGETIRPLSRAALEQIEASESAGEFVFKMQRRHGKRATTAHAVIRALLPDASDDLKTWEWMLRESDDGPPRDVVLEIVEAKRVLVAAMGDYLRRFSE